MTMTELKAWLETQNHVEILTDTTPTDIHFKCDHSEGKFKRSLLREQLYSVPNHYIISKGSNVGIKEYKLSINADVSF